MKGWEMISQIKQKLRDGHNVSRISRELKIDRKTVRKYRDMTFEEVADYHRTTRTRKRKLDKFKEIIDKKILAMQEDGVVNAQSIYGELMRLGYSGSPRSLRRYVETRSRKTSKKSRTYEPFETAAGYQAMVDLGESRKVWISGIRTVRYFVVMTLSYSRRMYVEWYDRPIDTQMFLIFHQNAFRYFGGIPQELVYDQTKLVSIAENFGEIEFNELFHGYAQWMGFKIYLCRGNDPETKGKVESSVRYIKRSFLPGRRFAESGDIDREWWDWLTRVADRKPNETTLASPFDRWLVEAPVLRPIRESMFEIMPSYRQQPVYEDGCVKVLGNRYSVPREYQGQQVKIRVTDQHVEIATLEGKQIHQHERCHGKGQRITVKWHYHKAPSETNERLKSRMLEIYRNPALIPFIQNQFPRHFREQFQQLIKLQDAYDPEILHKAGRKALEAGVASYKNIKSIALYIAEMSFDASLECGPIPMNFQGVQAIEIEQRPVGYYDHLLESRS